MGLLADLYRGDTHFRFSQWWRRGLVLSGVLLAASILSLSVQQLNLGIDFEGGSSWEVRSPGTSVADARDVMRSHGDANAKIQIVDGEILRIQSTIDDPEQVEEITAALRGLGDIESFNAVGPSWGREITNKAIRALVWFFVLLAAFISWRLEWRMAVAALVAVVHDIVISVGVYSVFQLSVTPATVVAFLTILGYSLYDTIVVFDKVVELVARPAASARHTFTGIMDTALNAVVMRSVNTTITGVLPVLSMLVVGTVLGAETLLEFAVALLVGLIVGAYSSIFVAAPMLVWLKEREPRYRALRERAVRTGAASAGAVESLAATGAPGPGSDAGPGGERAGRGSGGAAPAPRPSPVGTIPPRPRKKKRR